MTANRFHPSEISDLRRRAEEKYGAGEAKPRKRCRLRNETACP